MQGTGASAEYFMVYSEGSEYLATPRNYGVLFVPEAWLGEAMGMPGTVNEYCILAQEGSEPQEVLESAQAALAPYTVVYGALGAEQPARELLDLDVQSFKELSEFFPMPSSSSRPSACTWSSPAWSSASARRWGP